MSQSVLVHPEHLPKSAQELPGGLPNIVFRRSYAFWKRPGTFPEASKDALRRFWERPGPFDRLAKAIYDASKTLLEPLRRSHRHRGTPIQPPGRPKNVMHLGTRSEG